MKEKIKSYFTLQRKKAFLELGIYIIFFILIFVFLTNKNINIDSQIIENKKFENYSNYSAIYNINSDDKKYEILFSRYENKYAIIIDKTEYLYVDNTGIYSMDKETSVYTKIDKDMSWFFELNPDRLAKLIEAGELISESKVLNTDKTKKKYLVEDYYITTYEEDKVVEVLIEYNEKNTVKIEYLDIDKVDDFDKE